MTSIMSVALSDEEMEIDDGSDEIDEMEFDEEIELSLRGNEIV